MTSTYRFSTLRLSALLAGLALFAFAAAPGALAQSSASSEAENSEAENSEATPDATVHVKGMACQMCARSMKNALGKLQSVEKADVHLDEQQVLLTFRQGQQATEEALREAVEGAGYTFRKVVFAESAGSSEASGTRR